MYVDMVKAGTVDNTVLTTNDDRVGLNAFSAGAAAVLRDRPEPGPRRSRPPTPPCTATSAWSRRRSASPASPGKGLMSISVKKDTKFPNASIALAQFFTNPRSMVEFSKQVAVYPSSPSAYDDPFFSTPADGHRGQRPAARRRTSSRPTRTSSRPSPKKADVNDIVLKAIESALFNKVAAAGGPDKAVADANKLIK